VGCTHWASLVWTRRQKVVRIGLHGAPSSMNDHICLIAEPAVAVGAQGWLGVHAPFTNYFHGPRLCRAGRETSDVSGSGARCCRNYDRLRRQMGPPLRPGVQEWP
jgi:hypothetical protein